MASVSGAAVVNAPINVTGILFNKTRLDTPLLNSIKRYSQASRVFNTGSSYDTGYPTSAVAGITENASMTAPTAQHWERVSGTNVTQIFHRAVTISYRKMANSADLTNYLVDDAVVPHLAGEKNNVPDEKAFQIANAVGAMRLDIENVLLNGTFQDSAGDPSVADQTRGLIAATTTNVVTASSAELSFDLIYSLVEKVMKAGTPFGLESYLCVLNYEQYRQLQKVVVDEGLKIDQSIAGANVTAVITPFGTLKFMPHRFMPNGTAELICLPVLGSVFQDTPGKGNFFYEELAKDGAAEKGQIFGMWGLDHGQEWLHGKITGLATTTAAFTAPKVYIANAADINA